MLTVPEAARRLRKNPETIRRWVRSGLLRSRKVGTQHLIDESDLAALAPSGTLPLPGPGRKTATGEPMPDFAGALRASRTGR
jgi:excisionase family DNA binding protein